MFKINIIFQQLKKFKNIIYSRAKVTKVSLKRQFQFLEIFLNISLRISLINTILNISLTLVVIPHQ